MKNITNVLRRVNSFAAAITLVVASSAAMLAPALLGHAAAVGQVTTRTIKMSDARPGATGVKYTVSFVTATTGTIQGVDVDFCGGGASDTPIIGDSNCALPTGMSLASATITNPTTGLNPTSTWAPTVINSSHTLEVSNASGASVNSGTTITFEINNVTNPTSTAVPGSLMTFYARITTFATTANAAAYTSGTPGTYVDYGGAALSVSSAIQITAKVMETLTFCVSGSSITNCSSGLTTPQVDLGAVVGSNKILDANAVYTANAYTQTSTNASSGVKVSLKTTSSATCAGLSSNGGTSCASIPAVASGATTPQTITAGTAAFGMCVTPGSANTTATAPYNNGGCTQYGMDDSSATKTWSTYGSQIFSAAGSVNQENDTLKYAATASNTTPAGIYSSTQSLIATGTF